MSDDQRAHAFARGDGLLRGRGLDDPLALPSADSPVLRQFCDHFDIRENLHEGAGGLAAGAPPRVETLCEVARSFSSIPYENLSKILRFARTGVAERSRRGPGEVVEDHVTSGAGGTCFSLTAALLHILRALGWRAEPILADRHYGADTHCALLVWINESPHLVDPGYLIVRPIPISMGGEQRISTSFNDVLLVPGGQGEKLTLFTENKGQRSERLTFKLNPVDSGEFLRAWDASFGWDMMSYPVLTRVAAGEQIYLQQRRLQVRNREEVRRGEVKAQDLPKDIAELFGLDPGLTRSALEILRGRGSGV